MFYSLDNGKKWSSIAARTTVGYLWMVPALTANTPTCLVKVNAHDAAGKLVASDVSDRPFTIEVVRVTSPNGGESAKGGEQVAVTGQTNATAKTPNKVTLSNSTDGGTIWTKIVDLPSNTGNYPWTVPSVSSPRCRVKVALFSNSTSLGSDISDADFTIAP